MSLPLEQQLAQLARAGIHLEAGITLDDLLVSFERREYEQAPFDALLYALGAEVEREPWGRRVCDAIWHLDTECIEDHGDYARVVRELARLAGVSERVTELRDHVDVTAGQAWVSYALDGQPRRLQAVVDSDWLDPEVLAALMDDLAPPGRSFASLADGQSVLLVCLGEEQLRALNALSPNPFHVLARRRPPPWTRLRRWLSRGGA